LRTRTRNACNKGVVLLNSRIQLNMSIQADLDFNIGEDLTTDLVAIQSQKQTIGTHSCAGGDATSVMVKITEGSLKLSPKSFASKSDEAD